MSINQLPNNELSIEIDTRGLLRLKKKNRQMNPKGRCMTSRGRFFAYPVDPFRRSTTSSKAFKGYARN